MKLGNKILIIGCPGSGKTTLSKTISKVTKLPIYHLDDYFWHEDWTMPYLIDWLHDLTKLTRKRKFIIDGMFPRWCHYTIPKAHTVIFLDFNPLLCLCRVFKRSVKHFLNLEDTLPKRIKQTNSIFPSWSLIKIILNFKRKYRVIVLNELQDFDKQLITLKSKKDVRIFLGSCGVAVA